jgi:hypothetical protein
MLAYCGRPAAASSCDRFPYIVPRYARETIAGICSLGVALVTAIISQTGSAVGLASTVAQMVGLGYTVCAYENRPYFRYARSGPA